MELLLDQRSYGDTSHSHQHDFHQLVLPLEGALCLDIAGRGGVVDRQHLAVISAGDTHSYAASSDNAFLVADIPAAMAPELERQKPFVDLSGALPDYIRFLASYVRQPVPAGGQREALLLLLKLLGEQFEQPLVDKRLVAAQRFIDANLAKPLTLAQISDHACVSSRQLHNLFLRYLDISPLKYLAAQRMKLAQRLVCDSALSIEAIALRCGYLSQGAFSHAYRRHFGTSPSQHRQL